MEDFTSAKVGDKVIFSNGWITKLTQIDRITKTCVEVDGALFRKNGGCAYTANAFGCTITHADDNKTIMQHRNQLIKKINKLGESNKLPPLPIELSRMPTAMLEDLAYSRQSGA